jgi:SulP family sulfate permease
MQGSAPVPQAPHEPTFAELFTPKLVTVLREGYGLRDLRADAVAGLTVAIVALPLSMAIAIASGTTPDRGLYTAIVGGFLISLLGGSRFQIGGPAGAFIVLVASIIERHGYDGLVIATLMAGVMLVAIGYLRLGTYIKYIPYPVTVGFTAGIATIIFASQLRELLGLTLAGREPAAFLPKLEALWAAAPTVNVWAVAVAAGSLALILILRRIRPTWPGFLIAVVAAGLAIWLFKLPVDTIGSRFGELPHTLPAPSLPQITLARLIDLFPEALAIALLGGIESLLSAVVADGMSGRRHRSNCELVAQGVGNIASVTFGGICVTGTIARTATNVRSGARGPISGMLHALFLAIFLLVAAPLASFIPLATLGAILAIVSWNMAEREAFVSLLRSTMGDRVVLLSTFLLTVFVDLTTGIGVGVVLGAFLFMHRMSQAVAVETHTALGIEDEADGGSGKGRYEPAREGGAEVMVYRLSGPFFFGSTANVAQVLDRIGRYPKAFVLDFAQVPFIDSSAAHMLETFAHKLARGGAAVFFTGLTPALRDTLQVHGLDAPLIRFTETIEAAQAEAKVL